MLGTWIIFVCALGLSFGVSMLCSLMEAALLSITPGQLAMLKKIRPRAGETWGQFKDSIEKPIAAILFLNTSAHTIGASVAGAQFTLLFHNKWVGIFSGLFTFLMFQYTEILPKSLGVRFNTRVAIIFARPLLALVKLLTPVIRLCYFLNRPFEPRRSAPAKTTTVDEISSLAAVALKARDIGPHQERIISGSARLTSITAQMVMVPVHQITFLGKTQSLGDAIVTAHMDPHTRFPVVDQNDSDKVLGYVNFKEVVAKARTNPRNPTMEGIIRPVEFVPPGTRCSDLLARFVDQHVHMAIVRGESGRTLGLVTLEDIVEELIGHVADEFDTLPKHCHLLSGNVWIIGGGLRVHEMETNLKANLGGAAPETRVSEWIASRMGRAPVVNSFVRVAGLVFVIRRIRRGQVYEISVQPDDPELFPKDGSESGIQPAETPDAAVREAIR